MGSIRKNTATKPVPAGTEFFTRGGIRFARWKSSTGKSKTAKLTVGNDGADKIVVESSVWFGKYNTGDGRIVEKTTGCRDKQAAAAVVAEWERRSERVKSGIVSASEDAIADHAATPSVEQFADYLQHLEGWGREPETCIARHWSRSAVGASRRRGWSSIRSQSNERAGRCQCLVGSVALGRERKRLAVGC